MNFLKIEKKWQKIWEKSGIYKIKDKIRGKENFYHLVMFPYPSGNLHIGHWYNFAPADVFARFKRMRGFNVLSPIGFDAFGLPAENAAIKRGIHPKDWTYKNIKTMAAQLKSMGNMYDWSRQIITADPEYYKWTQWMFLQLYKKGLVYRKKAAANWCPKCHTVLANEQVIDGKCERCDSQVIQREIEQWLFKITDYAERLLEDLDKLDWPEKTKTMQKNWIGRSEGAVVKFKINPPAGGQKLGFDEKLVPLVLSGEKYITYRLNNKGFKAGDVCEFINSQTNEKFAVVKITKIEKKKIRDISEQQEGHEKFKNRKEFYKTYENYYKTKVNNNTDVWLYHFELIPEYIEIFTTRLDTIFGCTYLVVAPERANALIQNSEFKIQNYNEVIKYIEKAKEKSDLQRTELQKGKTGVELKGVKAISPFNNEEIPIFVADYVLGHYGTGAVMAVPAHDERDFEFAKKYKLPIKKVVSPKIFSFVRNIEDIAVGAKENLIMETECFIGNGELINSGQFTGLTSEQAREKMADWLEKNDLGAKKVNYKLRDWLVSRQRYWGAPIPIIYCEKCGEVAVSEKDLPIRLPNVKNYLPTEEGRSPLAHSEKFINAKCPKCGGKAKRETDTMDTFVCSSWYYLRYVDHKNFKKFADSKKIKKWLPVDMYIGGAEHSVLHLLYARFFTKVLYDLKYLNFNEPFLALRHQGIILGTDGQKMSKSRGNVIDPDVLVKQFGADCVRMHLCFMGPYDQGGPWNPTGILGVKRFLERVSALGRRIMNYELRITNKKFEILLHKTIKKVTEDIENFQFNTAISSLMILFNEMEKEKNNELRIMNYELFLKLLAPFAPHLSEELWQQLGNKKSIHLEKWPKYNPKLIKEEEFDLIIQINGKMRDKFSVAAGISQKEAEKIVLNRERVKSFIGNQNIKKIIFVPGKLMNIVV